MQFEPWQVWFAVGFLLLIIDIFMTGFALGGAGIACLVSGGFALSGFGFGTQAGIFFAVTVLFFFSIKPLIEKSLYSSKSHQKTNVAALPGQIGSVTERIDPLGRTGRVVVNGEDWKAVSEDNQSIDINQLIEVVSVRGSQLIIRGYPSQGGEND